MNGSASKLTSIRSGLNMSLGILTDSLTCLRRRLDLEMTARESGEDVRGSMFQCYVEAALHNERT